MLPVLPCFDGPHIKLADGVFTTGTCLSESIFYFLNIATVRWSDLSCTITKCAAKYTSYYAFSISFLSHDSVALL